MAIKIKSEWRDKKKGNVVCAGQCAATQLRTGTHQIFEIPCLFRDFDGGIFRDAILRKFYILNHFNFSRF